MKTFRRENVTKMKGKIFTAQEILPSQIQNNSPRLPRCSRRNLLRKECERTLLSFPDVLCRDTQLGRDFHYRLLFYEKQTDHFSVFRIELLYRLMYLLYQFGQYAMPAFYKVFATRLIIRWHRAPAADGSIPG